MTRIWFTSDPHFGHNMVAELRGFSSAGEHDDAVLESLHGLVGKRDQLWWLGDMTLKNPKTGSLFTYLQAMPWDNHLVAGNHDSCHPMHRDAWKWQKYYLDNGFCSVQPFAKRRIGTETVLLSHFPYMGPEADRDFEPRHQQYRLPDLGLWLLHGHTHMEEQRVHGRQIHVGWDAWNRPASVEEIGSIIKEAQ